MAVVGGSEKSGVVIDLSGTVVFAGKGPPVLVLQSIDQAVLSAKADECAEMRRFAVAHRVDQRFGIGETGRGVIVAHDLKTAPRGAFESGIAVQFDGL